MHFPQKDTFSDVKLMYCSAKRLAHLSQLDPTQAFGHYFSPVTNRVISFHQYQIIAHLDPRRLMARHSTLRTSSSIFASAMLLIALVGLCSAPIAAAAPAAAAYSWRTAQRTGRRHH